MTKQEEQEFLEAEAEEELYWIEHEKLLDKAEARREMAGYDNLPS